MEKTISKKFLTFDPQKHDTMASITLDGKPIHTSGELPKIGSKLSNSILVQNDLSIISLDAFLGKKLVLNIFPSVGTGVCASAMRTFNKLASNTKDTTVLCISRDLPFAQKSFCAAEGISNVITLSDFKDGNFGKTNGLEIIDGKFAGLLSRVVIVTDEKGRVIYTEQVGEIADEPNYEAALAVL